MNKISTHFLKYPEISVNQIDLVEELFFTPEEIEHVKSLFINVIAEPATDSVRKIFRKI